MAASTATNAMQPARRIDSASTSHAPPAVVGPGPRLATPSRASQPAPTSDRTAHATLVDATKRRKGRTTIADNEAMSGGASRSASFNTGRAHTSPGGAHLRVYSDRRSANLQV